MRKIIGFLIICLIIVSSYQPSIGLNNFSNENFIDVKIGNSLSNQREILVSSIDGFNFYNRSNKMAEIYKIEDKNILISIDLYDNIVISDMEGNFIWEIPYDEEIVFKSISNEYIRVDNKNYRDYISFIKSGNNINIINHIDIEKYLYGVVPREMGPGYHKEALKAQSIASRSFTVANMNKHQEENFNLCDTTHCQVYGGYDYEKFETNEAIDETRSEYITYNNEIINAIFHSNSGGFTESSSLVWGGHRPYLTSVEDKFSEATTSSNWTLSLSSKEINSKLSASGINIGELIDMEVKQTSDSNRVLKIKLIGTLKEEEVDGTKLRTIIGSTSFKSTWFNISKDGINNGSSVYVVSSKGKISLSMDPSKQIIIKNSLGLTSSNRSTIKIAGKDRTINLVKTLSTPAKGFTFHGKGYGHGVGMSQQGAGEMGKLGYTYEEILKHYYTGVKITNYMEIK